MVEEADAATKSPIIILIDALDEMETENNAHELEWLPLTFPPNIRFIVSTTEQSVVNSRAFDILRISSMSRAVLQEIMDKQLKNFAGKVGIELAMDHSGRHAYMARAGAVSVAERPHIVDASMQQPALFACAGDGAVPVWRFFPAELED